MKINLRYRRDEERVHLYRRLNLRGGSGNRAFRAGRLAINKNQSEGRIVTIREVSEKAGVSADNLRFYEKIGLLPPVPRKESGVREYDAEMLAYIIFVMQLKKTGMTLEALSAYIRLALQGRAAIRAQRAILEQTRETIVLKLMQLNECLAQIDLRLASCASDTRDVEERFSALWRAPLEKIS